MAYGRAKGTGMLCRTFDVEGASGKDVGKSWNGKELPGPKGSFAFQM